MLRQSSLRWSQARLGLRINTQRRAHYYNLSATKISRQRQSSKNIYTNESSGGGGGTRVENKADKDRLVMAIGVCACAAASVIAAGTFGRMHDGTRSRLNHVIPKLHPCFCQFADASDTAYTRTNNSRDDDNTGESSSSSSMPQRFQLKDVYDIEQVLGEGSFGMVYQARRKKDGLPVALKTMPREYTGKTDFEREVAALQLLSKPPSGPHDHIVKLYDLHRDDKNYYLAMELIEGDELFEHLIQNGPYSEAQAALFMRQFAEALCFVHSSGYIHADLKPENLMLATSAAGAADTMALKVVDFGCACTHDSGRKDLLLPAQEFALGCSFLHQVALGNQFELQRILQERPSLVNFRDYDKRTPLHIAASEGHLDICRFLVQRGARINRVDRWGGSPLDDAHRHGHIDVLEFLGQQGATFGSTALAIDKFINAASQGDIEVVQAMIKFGKIDLNQGDYDCRTALHLAAGEGRLGIVKLLCEAGADVNVKDRWGNLPLDDAKSAKKNSADIVEILEQYGAKSISDNIASPQQQVQSNSALKNKVEDEATSGTIAYWAPELFAKGAKPTPAADQWAAGVIVYLLLTGSHPFDKHANKTDEEIAQDLIKVSSASKAKDGEEQINVMDELVFDERIEGLSDSCIDLMKKLMHPDPGKRMTSEDFRRHPWVQGLTASWTTMTKTHAELQAYWQNRFRAEILKRFSTSLGVGRSDIISEKDLEAMFRALDLKQNGVLELDEVATVLRQLGASDKNIRQIFACVDLDGTGVIRWDEFRVLMSKHGSEDDGDGSGPGLQVRYLRDRFKSDILNRFDNNRDVTNKGKLREIFNAIDLEGNGVLDPHEIRVVLRSVGEPEDVISRIVASLDINRDGGVDWAEFQEIMGIKEDEN